MLELGRHKLPLSTAHLRFARVHSDEATDLLRLFLLMPRI